MSSVISPDEPQESQDLADKGAGPSRRVIFIIIVSAIFMCTVDATIVATALHAIHRSLGASINWAAWTISIFALGFAIALPISGRVSDHLGRRKVFLFGVVLFTASSLCCGISIDIYMLIFFRLLQAIGAGAFTPAAAGIISDHFGADRDRGIGMFGTVAAAGQITGPVLGGVIVGYLSWRWIFFVNVPIGIVVIFYVIKFIPESPILAAKKADIHGLLLMGFCIFTSIFGITNLGSKGGSVPFSVASEACAAVLLYLFIRHTRHSPSPFISMRYLVGRGFGAVNVQSLIWGAAGFGIATLTPLYAQDRYHLGALNAGTLLTARAVGMIAIGAAATMGLRRTGYRLPLFVGYTVVAFGTFLVSISPRFGWSPYLWLSVGAGFMGLGNGVANPASRNASLQLAPEDVPTIAGVRQMFNNIGAIFSVSIVTAVINRSSDPGIAQAHIQWIVVAIIMIALVPLVFRIPEHKGSW